MQSVIINSLSSATATETNEIRLDFKTPLSITNKQVSLGYLGVYYSWRNITSKFNNNKLQYIWVNNITYDVNIDDGFYSINDLSTYLHQTMYHNQHYMFNSAGDPVYFIEFESNSTYYLTTILCTPVLVPNGGSNGNSIPSAYFGYVPQLVIPTNNITLSLGINAGTYPPTARTTIEFAMKGQNVPQISPITTVNVACNISSNDLNQYRSIIYQFAPTKPYGSYLEIQTTYPVYYNILNGTYDHISLTFVDQNYSPIALIDKNITATLLIKSSNTN